MNEDEREQQNSLYFFSRLTMPNFPASEGLKKDGGKQREKLGCVKRDRGRENERERGERKH